MSDFLLHHRHAAPECGVVFASFRGHASRLRRTPTIASCLYGGHEIWWVVEAATAADALGLLPLYVASRTSAIAVGLAAIP